MTILILALLALNLVVTPLILWRVLSINRRQRNDDLRFHAGILLRKIETELYGQQNRLIDRLRPIK